VETQYDPLSRAYKVSNPHNSTAQYWTETDFDALGRPLRVIPPDSGATTTYTYSTTAVTVTDGAGKQRKSVSDGLGRLVTAYEPDVANGNSLTQQTSYAYTVLDALATVTQGVQTRTFTYDGLGRLTSQTTPEANGVGYQYNNFNLVTQRTDARGVVTTYGYDALNRLNQISYNVGSTGVPATASVNFAYGTSSASFNNGRLLTMTDGLGSETYTYDQLGRVIQLQKVLNGTGTCQSSMPCNIVYAYNLANELTSITYPSGRVVNQSYDSTARLTAISNGGTGSNYASGFGYNPAGQVTGFNYGNGVAVVFGYSPQLLQLATLGYSTNTQTLFSLSYGYVQNGGNNGQITSINDGIQPGRTANYTYDALNRLGTAVTNGSTGYSQWGLSWTYDRYGNRTAQTPTAGTAPSSSLSVNPTSNRINSPGFTYDANGNLTVEPLVSNYNYSYDAANRLVSFASGAANATYAYDGHGRRAQKVSSGNTTVYIFSGPRVLAEYLSGSAASSPSKEYVYVGSTLLTTVTGSAATYHHRDHLSIRISTNQSADVVAEQGHFPYGESWYLGTQSTQWQFTDYERDAESGNDYATFRYYVSRQGRFLTLDPLAGTASNPQSWNRYAYVRNDPCSRTDPLGLAECDFNVQFNNDAGLGDNQTTAIQQRINQIYGAVASPSGDTVGVKFNFSGKADATLTATNASWFTNLLWKRSGKLGPLGSEGGLWGPPKIYMNNLPTGFPAADTAMQAGGVGAHELAHLLLGSPDLPYDASNPNLLMFYTAPEEAQFGALVHPESALWKLTSDQVSTLFRKCSKAHPTNNPASSGGHGGGGGGNEFWFEDWLLGMMESLFGGGGSTEVVTHRFID
jgi:RHS repeat-associated protein